ncbi:hypothetical protein [uncultured Mitsuokella sp.]|uniref:hypothetical protein n=1 Tax=uncultured Mitsuokella sp. TaxID=453120 RepID=UPI0025DD88B3|nr:hypothetical protein [uncultured Mitsuokella sp.]
MANNMELYEALQTPPNDALKPITYGALKGKSDINPQWRYEALTNALGPCGIGWKFEIADTKTQSVSTGETMVFVLVNLYIKQGDEWSAPIPGWGGDYLVKKDKNGIHGNDEAFKMATTDALGTAAKMIGLAADVYRGLVGNGASDSKYARRGYAAQNAQNGAGATANRNGNATTNAQEDMRRKAMHSLNEAVKKTGISKQELIALCGVHFGKASTSEMTTGQISIMAAHLEEWVAEAMAGGKE